MKEQRPPHQQLTTQDNQLTATQEVLYRKEFKRADKSRETNEQTKK